jgi:oligoribonuclease NrnB/cAMP/cGMP phosphodiesterase (DHH superfamily)
MSQFKLDTEIAQYQKEALNNINITQYLTTEQQTELDKLVDSDIYSLNYLETILPQKINIISQEFTTLIKQKNKQKVFDKYSIDWNDTVVLYHANCSDGFGSAFIVWKYSECNDNVIYIPMYYLKPTTVLTTLLEKVTDKNVIMLDYSCRMTELLKIIIASKSFIILDHHKTAEKDLQYLPGNLKRFNMNKSGVGMTWEYFFGANLPLFFEYIQDRDLWTKKYSETEDLATYLAETEHNFMLWNNAYDNVIDCIETGKKWNITKNNMIKKHMDSIEFVLHKIDGNYHIFAYVNCPDFQSDTGDTILEKCNFISCAVMWGINVKMNLTFYSLRSSDNKLDVSIIAKQFGGGGHRNASGCSIENKENVYLYEKLPMNMFQHKLSIQQNDLNDMTYLNKLTNKICNKHKRVIHRIKGKPYVFAYVNTPILRAETRRLMARESNIDFIVVWSKHLNNVYYEVEATGLYSSKLSMLNMIFDDCIENDVAFFMLENKPVLLYDKVFGYGIQSLLNKPQKEEFIETDNYGNVVILTTDHFNEKWLEEPLVYLLVRKYIDNMFIVITYNDNNTEKQFVITNHIKAKLDMIHIVSMDLDTTQNVIRKLFNKK